MVAYTVGQDDLAAGEVHEVLQVRFVGTDLIRLLLPSSHKHNGVLGMPLAVYLDLLCTNDVSLFAVFFDRKVEQPIAEGHRVRKIPHFLSDDEDLELLGGVYGGDEAGALLDYFCVELADLLGLAVALRAGVEDSGELNSFGGAGIPEFDVCDSFEEGVFDDFSLVGEVGLLVLAHAVGQHAGVDCASGLVAKEQLAEDGDDLEDLVLVGGDLYLEFHVFAEGDEVPLILVLVDGLHD